MRYVLTVFVVMMFLCFAVGCGDDKSHKRQARVQAGPFTAVTDSGVEL